MKDYKVTQFKWGVNLLITDPDQRELHNITFTWQEIAGLKWAIDDLNENPAFRYREPKKPRTMGPKREFVEFIQLVEGQ